MNITKVNLSCLSKYRTECMGLAILFVFGVHSLDFNIMYKDFMRQALRYGQIGVNIFFLLSGLGMFYSLRKVGIKQFYKNRAIRLLPTYLVISIPFFFIVDVLLDNDSIVIYLFDLLTLRYWFQGIGYWYVAVSILMYLIIPWHHVLRQKAGKYGWCINLLAVVLALLLGQYVKVDIHTIGLFFERYAIFIIGYWLAEAVESKKNMSILIAIIAIISVWLKSFLPISANNFMVNLSLAFAGFGLCILFCWFLEVTNSFYIRTFFYFIGSFTLECYMMNVSINWILLRRKELLGYFPDWLIYWGVSVFFATIIGYCIHNIVKKSVTLITH